MLDIQEEVCFHKNRLDEFKTQFKEEFINRESLLARLTAVLHISILDFSDETATRLNLHM